MTPLETVGTFVGIPASVFLVIAALVYGTSARRSKRYRPGRPFDFAPVWFLAAVPDAPAAAGHGHSAGQLTAAAQRTALPAGSATPSTPKGGASGSW
ncbi:aa3-type cytochrome oxidase subunit CtaJ [Fodinicola feengrottensis]|uniref:Uncharacterized protein n=1 Tax=Fodinicola feengrottensis TaxID=435914 RepID=A0ABP4UBC0_9ACTN|nr:hypothetical protein [Fodinicola feengrottensis]